MDIYKKVSDYLQKIINGFLFDMKSDDWSGIFATIGYEEYILFEYGKFDIIKNKIKTCKSCHLIEMDDFL